MVSVAVTDYASRDFRNDATGDTGVAGQIAADIGYRRYTSTVDLEFPTQLLRPPWAAKGGFQVRYARDIKLGDLKGSNLILSGVAEANPWVSLFEKKMNFHISTRPAIPRGAHTDCTPCNPA